MIYINTSTNEYPITIQHIRSLHPDTAFPANPSDTELSVFGFASVAPTTRPEFDTSTQRCVRGIPELDGAQYVQTWVVSQLDATELSNVISRTRAAKLEELKQAFAAASITSVTSGGFTWNGGDMSAIRLSGKADTLEHMGDITGGIHDITNTQRTLTVSAIRDIAADISVAFESHFDLYQARKNEVAACGDDNSCIAAVTYL